MGVHVPIALLGHVEEILRTAWRYLLSWTQFIFVIYATYFWDPQETGKASKNVSDWNVY